MDVKVEVAALKEKVASLDEHVELERERVSKLEIGMKEDLTEIKADVKEITAWMNRGKGWIAAAVAISSLLGGLLANALASILHLK